MRYLDDRELPHRSAPVTPSRPSPTSPRTTWATAGPTAGSPGPWRSGRSGRRRSDRGTREDSRVAGCTSRRTAASPKAFPAATGDKNVETLWHK